MNRYGMGHSALVAILAVGFLGCGGDSSDKVSKETIVVYSGRSQSLIEPLLRDFESMTGIDVRVKYGKSAQLALALHEESAQSPADVFWSQDAGALGVLAKAQMFQQLPEELIGRVPEYFGHSSAEWVATSGRARLYAYSPAGVIAGELPTSVLDLTKPVWKGRVGWAPLNASFQSFVTALRRGLGEDRAREWLEGMKTNEARSYAKNTAIIEAIAAGEIDLGLPNHYYLLRFKKTNADFPVEQNFFAAKDIGNLVNVAGVGVLKTSKNVEGALEFVRFLLSEDAQRYFVDEVFEFSVIEHIESRSLFGIEALMKVAPDIDLNDLDDLNATLDLLREVGLL